VINSLTEKYKKAGLEMDVEIELLIKNARIKIEQYKGQTQI